MSPETTVALLSAIGAILQAIIWPAVLVFILLWFRKPLIAFLQNLSELNVKAGPGGIEWSAKVEAAASLGKAVGLNEAKATADGERRPENAQLQPEEIASLVTEVARTRPSGRILWVDDQPTNNVYERQTFERLGIDVELSTSTNDALVKLAARRYDLIISDMGRPEDPQAGYLLLDRVRNQLNMKDLPYIIYAGSNDPKYDALAKSRGATGSTGNPTTLLSMVTTALGRQN